jgi:hypothetical protein
MRALRVTTRSTILIHIQETKEGNMRTSNIIFIILITLSMCTTLNAQEESRRLLGVGISIDPARIGHLEYYYTIGSEIESQSFANISPVLLYVPMDVSSSFRIEPYFGHYSNSSNVTTKAMPQSSEYPRTTVNEASITTVGLRGTYLSPLSSSLSLYVGPRFDLSFVSTSYEYSYISSYPAPGTTIRYSSTKTETDGTVGAVFGAEYYPVPQFSVGGEVGLNYIWYGNPEAKTDQYPATSTLTTTERTQHEVRTDALLFVRWFFVQVAQ